MGIAFVKQTVGDIPVPASSDMPIAFTSTAGNFLLLIVNRSSGAGTGPVTGVTSPEGGTWTVATRGAVAGIQWTRQELWYCANAPAMSGATVSFTNTNATSWTVLEFSGVAATDPLDAASADLTGVSSTTTPTTPAITAGAGDLVVAAIHYPQSPSTGPGGAWTSTADFDNDTSGSGRAAYQLNVAAGSYAATWTLATSENVGASTVAFKAEPSPSVPGLHVREATGTGTTADRYLRVMTAGGLAAPVARVVKPGSPDVSTMLSQTFYVAHGGGSNDWPEMSQYAYMRSATFGIDALEVSLARTSDGVLFGLHDAYLDRTSLGTSGGTTLKANTMTWADVQGYSILPNETNDPSQPARPYMRLEELLDQFGESHVMLVDPKSVWSQYWPDIFALLDAHGGPSRFIGKSFGPSGPVDNSTGFARDCADRGYTSWGYFYESDAGANLATYVGRWDLVGMDYTASQAAWDDLASYGKPIIGHIIPDAAAASTALTKGADGLMVSGVAEVMPTAV
jgi:hypothetical protein